MRVFQVEGSWSMENVTLGERPEPTPGPFQVRLQMRASSVNYRDLLVPLRGYGSRQQRLPLVLLSDGVGIVDRIGEGVTRVTPGERVCPLTFQSWIAGPPSKETLSATLGCELDGTMAEYMVLDQNAVVRAPPHLSDEEAASLPTAAVTAWRAIVTEGHVKPGDKVLVQGTGGVALFCLQFAKLLGAHVTVISSSDEKLARALAMGADAGINYRTTPEWGRRARDIVAREGLDYIVDVGGQDTLPQSLRAVRAGGSIALVGVLSGAAINVGLGSVVTRHVRLQGITVGNRQDFESLARAMSQHELHPVVDRVFAFEKLREAFAYLKTARHFGKVCIRHQEGRP